MFDSIPIGEAALPVIRVLIFLFWNERRRFSMGFRSEKHCYTMISYNGETIIEAERRIGSYSASDSCRSVNSTSQMRRRPISLRGGRSDANGVSLLPYLTGRTK